MKIAVVSPDSKAEEVIRQLLSPWHVNFSSVDEADIVVTYKTLKNTGKATVIIPSETAGFHIWLKENNLSAIDVQKKKLKVPATDTLTLTLTPRTQRLYMKSNYIKIDDVLTATRIDDSTLLLPVDLIEEYFLKLSQTLNPKISSVYKFLTGLPIPYTLAPSRFRDFFFTMEKVNNNSSYLEHLDLDALRYLLLWALENATGELLNRKTWGGHKCVCLLTHDVDTIEGLKRALALKRVEERYDIPSAWFLPTERYELDSDTIMKLANHGEVGAHDTKHNGRLDRLSIDEIVDRLKKAKRTLKTIVGIDIVGFRSPLLQHNEKIIQSIGKAEYSYDSSIPTWEPKHPSVMEPHGIGTVYPLDLYGIIEVPVSVPQDHQMIRVLGLNARQTVEKWLKIKKMINGLGGLCTFLVHPDYDLANLDNLDEYEEFINILSIDNQIQMMAPKDILLMHK